MTETQVGHFALISEEYGSQKPVTQFRTRKVPHYLIESGLSSEPWKLQHEKVTKLDSLRKQELRLISELVLTTVFRKCIFLPPSPFRFVVSDLQLIEVECVTKQCYLLI